MLESEKISIFAASLTKWEENDTFLPLKKKENAMKKYLLLFVFAIASSVMKAQSGEMYSLMFHNMVDCQHNVENFMRQHDGDYLFATFVATPWSPTNPGTPLGIIFYKMSPTTLTVTDSLFVADPNVPYYLFAPNPHDQDNIRASFEYHDESDSTFLHICRFPDNSLVINHDEDIVVPVCEGHAYGEADNNLVDSRGDLIWKYYKEQTAGESECHIIRFDAEGALKKDEILPSSQSFTYKLREFRESPLQYYHWKGYGGENLAVFVLDSIFHTKYFSIINNVLGEVVIDSAEHVIEREHLAFNVDTEVIPAGEDDILVAAQYEKDTTWHAMGERGVAVAKYDARTMRLKGYTVFNDYLGYYAEARCMGLKKMSDGTVYFAYKENGYPAEGINIVKMNVDMEVEWKRFCKTDNISLDPPFKLFSVLVEEGPDGMNGVAWIGSGTETNTEERGVVIFFLNHDGTTNENEDIWVVRPYTFYPNPAKDQLYTQFSPDVQPVRVELYDLQGRLVRTQRSAFETIDLSRLPAGTYTMRVVMKDGKTYSDKVVKE